MKTLFSLRNENLSVSGNPVNVSFLDIAPPTFFFTRPGSNGAGAIKYANVLGTKSISIVVEAVGEAGFYGSCR